MSAYPPPVAPMPEIGPQKPGMITALAIMTLINGILNIMYALGLTLAVVVSTIGIGILCAPATILPAILGILEIIYGAKLMANPPKPVQPSQAIAIMEICCILVGNIISVAVGVLALVFYNDATVKAYFAQINAQPPAPQAAYPPQQY